jgi:hypothetical protein
MVAPVWWLDGGQLLSHAISPRRGEIPAMIQSLFLSTMGKPLSDKPIALMTQLGRAGA